MEAQRSFKEGDWVVHAYYGVGRIEGTEEKDISGEKTSYFRIKTADSTYWMPVEQMNNELVRPLSSAGAFSEAVAALESPPREMSSNHRTRRSRIQEVRLDNSPQAIAGLIRDLRARKVAKNGLHLKERKALDTFKTRMAQEWAVVAGTRTEKVLRRIEYLLRHQAPAAE
jgi:RNA polymerase-interacting CarD/CdnL/TRCF family regulator